jgi:signal peptidase I
MVFTLIRLALAKIKDGWARTVSETCDTINFVLVLAFLLIRPFVAQAFYIPSESMENTLLVGDRLIVNKFGYRFGEPQRGDVIVFEAPPNAPGAQSGATVDYIKRLVAVPGDKLRITRPSIKLNGREVDFAPEASTLHDYLRQKLGLKDEMAPTGKQLQDAIKITSNALRIRPLDGSPMYEVSKEKVAEVLGQPGATVEMTPGQVILNGKPVEESFTREDPDYREYIFPADPETEITVEEGKLFVMGDNRNHSADSHYWGQLDRHRVVGKAIFVFWPLNRLGAIK